MHYSEANVLIVHKNFARPGSGISHIGLGVAALNNSKVLRAAGVRCDVRAAYTAAELIAILQQGPRTHVVISAPWIDTNTLSTIIANYPETKFYVVSHSNVGFLQADTSGVKLFREDIGLEAQTHNFHVAGNCNKFSRAVHAAFGAPCATMPNCYYLDGHVPHPRNPEPGGTIRIGAFGAVRPLKNFLSAAWASIIVAKEMRRPVEFTMNAGRTEGDGHTVLNAIKALLAGMPDITLHYNGWQSWDQFRAVVEHQHLLLQPSYTESFNMVTADGIAKGVPSIVSDAIDWVPQQWRGHFDNVTDLAQRCVSVLHNHGEARIGYKALIEHNTVGLADWGRALRLRDLPIYQVPTIQ